VKPTTVSTVIVFVDHFFLLMNEFERLTGKTDNPQLFTDVVFSEAQQLKRENPDTFTTPSDEDLLALEVGDIVKVCDGEERFWNVVKEINGDVIVAEVNNCLIGNQPYSVGHLIQFSRRHIYDIRTSANSRLMGETMAYMMELNPELGVQGTFEVIEELICDGVMTIGLVHTLMKGALDDLRAHENGENVEPSNGSEE
jgi:hypothetical protein